MLRAWQKIVRASAGTINTSATIAWPSTSAGSDTGPDDESPHIYNTKTEIYPFQEIDNQRSSPKEVFNGDWAKEIAAADELAKRGYANQPLTLLKEKLAEQEKAAGTNSSVEYSQFSLNLEEYSSKATGNLQAAPKKLDDDHWARRLPVAGSLTEEDRGKTFFALPKGQEIIDDDITGQISRELPRLDPIGTPKIPPMPGATPIKFLPSPKMNIQNALGSMIMPESNISQNYPLNLSFNKTRDLRFIGPAVGVPVGRIPTNPLFAPQTETQKRLLEALITKELKIGLLKANDGRVIMRKSGVVLLQPDRLGWHCGLCILKYPGKYNQWQGWMVHEIHQVGILDEYSVIMICDDCGLNPLSPSNLGGCVDAVITCARNWGDINDGILMEVLPVRVDCLCSQLTAKDLQDRILGTTRPRNPPK
ncbi:hypothetical protein QAD02_020762 [Eretmocerus hayati]|uniref:Uncharacterized protein n=1 Tax=Eretmocerus hayati TaxID=131215 RepID=A0ACC2PMZ0_9HYME|nr:hypothetical protein QAD02_020762 [Eretmocerus hayati]